MGYRRSHPLSGTVADWHREGENREDAGLRGLADVAQDALEHRLAYDTPSVLDPFRGVWVVANSLSVGNQMLFSSAAEEGGE